MRSGASGAHSDSHGPEQCGSIDATSEGHAEVCSAPVDRHMGSSVQGLSDFYSGQQGSGSAGRGSTNERSPIHAHAHSVSYTQLDDSPAGVHSYHHTQRQSDAAPSGGGTVEPGPNPVMQALTFVGGSVGSLLSRAACGGVGCKRRRRAAPGGCNAETPILAGGFGQGYRSYGGTMSEP